MGILNPPKFSRYEKNYFVITPFMLLLSVSSLAFYELFYSADIVIFCFFFFVFISVFMLIPTAIQASDYIFEKKAIKQFSLKTLFPEFEVLEMLEEIHSPHSKATIRQRVASLEKQLDCKISI